MEGEIINLRPEVEKHAPKRVINSEEEDYFALKQSLGEYRPEDFEDNKPIEFENFQLRENFQRYESGELGERELMDILDKVSIQEIILALEYYQRNETATINSLSEEVVRKILERIFSDYKSKFSRDNPCKDGGRIHFIGHLFLTTREGADDSKYYDDTPETLSDKTVALLPLIYDEYPEVFYDSRFMMLFGQDLQVAKPGVLLDSFSRFYNKPDTSLGMACTRLDILSDLNYIFSWYFGEYLEERTKPENLGDVRKDGMLLDLLTMVSQFGEGWGFSEKKSGEIKKSIERIRDQSDNYFIRKKSDLLLRENKKYGHQFIAPPGLADEENGTFVQPTASEKLIYGKTGRTAEELRYLEELVRDFQYLKGPEMQKEVEKDFGISLDDLSDREQMCFLGVLRGKKITEVERVKNIVLKYGLGGIRSFLASEYGEQYGQSVLEIGEKLPQEQAQAIFAKYSEIIKATDNVAGYLRQKFGANKDYDEKTIDKIVETILRRGKDLMASFAQEIQDKKPEEIDQMKESLMQKLAQYQEDAILFGATFRALFKGKAEQVDFSEIADVNFERANVADLTDEDKAEMLGVSEANWQSKGQIGSLVVEEFKEALDKKEGSNYWVLKKNNKIVAFMRFDQTDKPSHLHAASLNVAPQYRGSAIGEAMRKIALAKMSASHIIEGEADPVDTIGMKYVEEDGFVISGAVIDPNKNDQYLEIYCDKKGWRGLMTRSMEKDFLLRNIDQTDDRSDFVVRSFDIKTDLPRVLAEIKELTSLGYLGTRYFEDNGRRIYVFEKAAKEAIGEKKSREKLEMAA